MTEKRSPPIGREENVMASAAYKLHPSSFHKKRNHPGQLLGAMASFTDLPFELLELIAASLWGHALKSFSLVNKRCRAASEHIIFSKVKIKFSQSAFTVLEELSRSPLGAYVNTLHYDASELFDPGMYLNHTLSILISYININSYSEL